MEILIKKIFLIISLDITYDQLNKKALRDISKYSLNESFIEDIWNENENKEDDDDSSEKKTCKNLIEYLERQDISIKKDRT